ncbi:MAG: hypothetical protein ACE15E_11835, partial [Acidobacteriota bacterium]
GCRARESPAESCRTLESPATIKACPDSRSHFRNSAIAMSSLPAGFLWGAATSSHQVEGDNRLNDWWKSDMSGPTE